ncbi:3,9-dihydroxypterocarpan 6A-monooxygenase [Zea mays]|uniref:Cytochrome P450 family 93 subfamily D polypeptide 1 n=2 Tax=Zea mays TaxID=4577 RepID=A0A1D6EG50_MAIZE|nr:cytochrome P450 93G1 [Zea mays]ONM19154.1 cytochrome P450 family 93 subfamily D polypeptide 1 [Zea mays]PWZ41784.1 3,9-dihydroxypterocarpan 6A-monooxygenase [Zea mays]|eukprot:XP_008669737.2 cytochrome P450 93G1 [Zea mays]
MKEQQPRPRPSIMFVLSSLAKNNPEAVLALIAVVTVVALRHLISSWRQQAPLPPSPTSLPVIGHLHLLRPPVHRTFQELASRIGPLMHIRLGSTHCVVASSPEVASELIRGHEGSISERPLTAVARQFAYDSAGFAFAPYNTHWRFMKRLCMSELLGPRTVEQLRPIRRAGTVSLLGDLLASSARGETVDLTRHLIRLSNTSIIRMVASTVPGSVTDEAQKVVKDVAELVGAFNVDDYIAVVRGWDLQGLRRRAADVHRRFDALLEDILRHKEEARAARRLDQDDGQGISSKQDKKQATHSKDLLDILMDKAEDQAAEVKLTRENIKAFIIDVVTAGSDTSAAMVEWMLAELMNHQETLRKVVEEIDAVVGGDRIASEADLPRLPYLMAAYKETLRLHPAAPIAHRQSSEEMVVRGFTVPPQTAVFINVWAIGRDPAYWEEPLAFRPERFMPGGAAESLEPRGQHFQYMPFGSGRRGCPGMGLALQSVPAVLAALVQCFHWATVDGDGGVNKIDMSESDGLVCARKKPLLLRPTPRLTPFPAVV